MIKNTWFRWLCQEVGAYAEMSAQAVGSEEEGHEQRRAEMGLVRPVLWTVLSGPPLH